MQFFSEEYLMHYGVKGMKWRKHDKKKDPLAGTTIDDYYDHSYYDENGHRPDAVSPEENAIYEHNKRAKKLRKIYNKRKKKEYKRTVKIAKRRGLNRPRRRSTDHINTILGKTQHWSSPVTLAVDKPPTYAKVYRREKAPRNPQQHPIAGHSQPIYDYNAWRKRRMK